MDTERPVVDCLGGYRTAIADTIAPMALTNSSDEFRWRVDHRQRGVISSGWIGCDDAVHGRVVIPDEDNVSNDIALILVVRGAVELKDAGRYAKCDADSFILMKINNNAELWQDQPTELFTLRMPTRTVGAYCADIEKLCGIIAPAKSGTAQVLASMVKTMATSNDDTLTKAESDVILSAVGGITDCIFKKEGDWELNQGSVQFYQERLRQEIDRSIGDSDLSPSILSQRLGISRSYLYSIACRSGCGVNEMIIERRLELCRAALDDSSWASKSLTGLAFFLGFKDLSHFSRRFSQRYGCSPLERRQRNVGLH